MKIEHLNLSRQLAKQCKDCIAVPSLDPERKALMANVLDLHGASTKFLLPDGGRLLDDGEYKALDESQALRLPYPYIAIEYQSNGNDRTEKEPIGYIDGKPKYEDDSFVSAPKRVVFARERDDWIVITVAFWTKHDGLWRVLPECAIPNVNYLDRTNVVDGRVAIKFAVADQRFPLNDYMDELGALLCFLNVLQCTNVHIERSDPKKPNAKVKAALPFDSYHVLTIDSASGSRGGDSSDSASHRSPREHLRRGHIRRLSDGRRIWVNAAIVGAGKIAGVISKDYAIKEAA
jgi:hypothetical protein